MTDLTKYNDLFNNLEQYIGGRANISFFSHCVTRLRLNLKDKNIVNCKQIENINGVLGTQWAGSQLQIIIGMGVDDVYNFLCDKYELEKQMTINENLDGDVKKLTFKYIINSVLDIIAACITPLQPVIIFAGVVKMIPVFLGPSMLNVLAEGSDLYRILNIAGDAGFYFFPMYLAYASSKKFGCNTMLAMLMGGILIHPSLIEIINSGEPFTIYGIPMTMTSYASSFLPIILITFVMAKIEKIILRHVPTSLKSILYPLLLILIMLPLGLCLLGPIGTWIGELIANTIVSLHSIIGPFAIAIIAALWSLLVAVGMHQAIIAIAITYMSSYGYDDTMLVGAIICFYAMMAIDLAYLIKAKSSEQRATASTSLVTLAFGGISEPSIFGILLKDSKALRNIIIGGFCGGLYAGIMHIHMYFPAAGNIFGALAYAGEKAGSFTHGVIACVIAAVVAFVLCMIFGFNSTTTTEIKR